MASGLTSASDLETVRAVYRDNADWEEQRSVTKARDFITACRHLLDMVPASETQEVSGHAYDPDRYVREMEAARDFVRRHGSNEVDQGGRRFFRVSFQTSRGR